MMLLALSGMTLVYIGVFAAYELHFFEPNKDLQLSMVESQTIENVGIESIIEWGQMMIAVHYPTTTNPAVNQRLRQYANDLVNQFKQTEAPSGHGHAELYVSFRTYKSGEDILGFQFDLIERHASGSVKNETQKLSFNLRTGDEVAFDNYFDENNQPIVAQTPNPEHARVVTPESTENKKLVALTFDDGPHPEWTNTLLDILQRENVPVTFFVLGSRANHYPDIVQRAASSGHQIASHTFNHKNLTKLSPSDMRYEIDETANIIERITGGKPAFMRPPYGAIDQAVKDAAGTPLITWSVDPEDWKSRNTEQIFTHVTDHTTDGSIVLLHDMYGTTVDAVTKIIPEMRSRGFVFLTVRQLMDARGRQLENGGIYRQAAP